MKIRFKAFAYLVRMHPRSFRERFGDEMLAIFDEAEAEGEGGRMLWSAAISAARQWMLRPEPATARIAYTTFGVLEFPTPAWRLLPGACITLALFSTIVYAISHAKPPRNFIGSFQPRIGLIHIDRDSMTNNQRGTTRVRPAALKPDAIDRMAKAYMRMITPLSTLDENGDGVIDMYELTRASGSLRRTDRNHDGFLDARECGYRQEVPRPVFLQAEREFMSAHPALAALDSNGDGRIDRGEMEAAAKALRKLDRNHDGALAAIELIPTALDNETSLIMQVDADFDGRITQAELLSDLGRHYAEFLLQADSDSDGNVTRPELQRALLASLDSNRDGVLDWKELLGSRSNAR